VTPAPDGRCTPPEPAPDPTKWPGLAQCPLFRGPFYLLGASVRDDRRKILELCEQHALSANAEACGKARADLINPRRRLAAELGWFPGVAPGRAVQMLGLLRENPDAVRAESGLPPLARANLMSALWSTVRVTDPPAQIAALMQETATLASKVSAPEILQAINADRSISGFPPVASSDDVEAALAERFRELRGDIIESLNRLPTDALVQTVTIAVGGCTNGGEMHAPPLIEQLIDAYELEAQRFMAEESNVVKTLIDAALNGAVAAEGAMAPFLPELHRVLSNWVKVARPIQLGARARGVNHEASVELAQRVRQFCIGLLIRHNIIEPAARVNDWIGELFALLPDTGAVLRVDEDEFAKLSKEARERKAKWAEWREAIRLRAEFGLFKKDVLTIDSTGIRWNHLHYPLQSITFVRWGGLTQSSLFGKRTTYLVAFGHETVQTVVGFSNPKIYSSLVEKLWRAVCWRLVNEMLQELKSGAGLVFAPAVIYDDGVQMSRRKWRAKPEVVRWLWHDLKTWDHQGRLHISAKADENWAVQLPYMSMRNVPILHWIISAAFKRPGMRRLSELIGSV
jgi:hypothetical protein